MTAGALFSVGSVGCVPYSRKFLRVSIYAKKVSKNGYTDYTAYTGLRHRQKEGSCPRFS